MSSSFHKDVQHLRHDLLSRLIKHIAGVEEHEENFGIAYEFIDQNLKHHRYLDVNPREVDSKYDSLQARFRTNSMHSSADRLQELHGRLCALSLKGRYADLNHSILQLLICLAGKPVDPRHVVSALSRRSTSTSTEVPAALAAPASVPESEIQSASSSSVFDPWEDNSDLSSWDEDETYEREEGLRGDKERAAGVKWYSDAVPDAHEQLSTHGWLNSSVLGRPLFIDAVLNSSVIPEHSRLEPADEEVPPRLTTCSTQQLAYVLAGQKLHAITGKQTTMSLKCYTDSYVVLEAVQLLKGLPSQLFSWDAQTNTYIPKTNILVPYLSPGCLTDMLKRFGQVAVRVSWLQQLVYNLSELSSVQHYTDALQEEGTEVTERHLLFGDSKVVMSPGQSALGESIRRQLDLALQPFLQLEASVLKYAAEQQRKKQPLNMQHPTRAGAQNGTLRHANGLGGESGPSRENGRRHESQADKVEVGESGPAAAAEQLPPHASSPLNLLTLSQLVTSFSSRLIILQQAVLEVLRSCLEAEQQPAAVTSAVVDSLVSQVKHWEQQGGPRGRLGQCITLHLLLSCLQPMSDSLQGWMFGGLGDMQLQRDFFIKQANALSAKDPAFWGSAYVLQKRADGSVACPAFLAPLADGILACGKALKLLHEMEFDKQREYHAWLASSSATTPHLALSSRLNAEGMTPLGMGVGGGWGASKDLWSHVELFGVIMHSVKGLLKDYHHPQAPVSHPTDRVVGVNSFFQCMARAGEAATTAHSLSSDLLGWVPPWIPPPSSADNVVPTTEQVLSVQPQSPSHKVKDATKERTHNSEPTVPNKPTTVTGDAGPTATVGRVRQALGRQQESERVVGDRLQESERVVGSRRQERSTAGVNGITTLQPAHQLMKTQTQTTAAVRGPGSETGVQQEGSGRESEPMTDVHGAVDEPEPMDVDEVIEDGERKDGGGRDNGGNRDDGRDDNAANTRHDLDGSSGEGRGPAVSTAHTGEQQPAVGLGEPSGREEDFVTNGVGGDGKSKQLQQQKLTEWLSGVKERLRSQEESMCSQWSRARAEAVTSCWHGVGGVVREEGAGSRLSHQLVGAQQLDWLLGTPRVEIPPVKLVLQECMVAHLQDRVEEVGEHLLGQLLSGWGLMAELEALRNVFLVGGPSMNEWVQRLLVRMFRGAQLVDLHEYELEGWMQEAFAQARPDEVLPPIDEINVVINPAAKADNRRWSVVNPTSSSRPVPQLERSVTELEGLVVRYNSSWLLSMITDASVLQQYNQVLVFLLQVRWAKVALDDVKQRSWSLRKAKHGRRLGMEKDGGLTGVWRQGRPVRASTKAGHRYSISKKDQGTLMEMTHFVTNLQHFITDQLLSSAWTQLTNTLQTARTLDDVRTAHSTFLEALLRQCCLSGTQGGTAATWKHVGLSMRKMLDCVLQFCAALGQVMLAENVGDDPEAMQLGGVLGLGSKLLEKVGVTELRERMAAAAEEFHRKCVYMLKVLATKTLKIGGDAELEYLIMRLNYNGVYNKQLGPELAWNGK